MNDVATQGGALSIPVNPLMNFLAQAARDPAVDLNKFEALLRMQRELVADEEKREFFRALSRVQSEMQPVVRDAENKQTNSKYAKLETIDAAIRPIYTRHGFSLTFNTIPHDGPEIRVTCDVSHDGYTRQYYLEALPDMTGAQGKVNKTQMHGMSSSVSYLQRYLTVMIFNVVLKNQDDDGNAGGGRVQQQRRGVVDDIVDAAAKGNGMLKKMTWIVRVKSNLDAEPNIWKWLDILFAALHEAPTFDDLATLESYEPVIKVRNTAPDPERPKIDAAFAAARLRLNTPPADSKKPAESQQQDEPRFYHVAFESDGVEALSPEGIVQEFYDPGDFALWYKGAYEKRGANKQALAEYNADALAAAYLDPTAKVILDALQPVQDEKKPTETATVAQDAPSGEQALKPVPMPLLSNGLPDFATYNRDLAADLARVTTESDFNAWVLVNQPVYKDEKLRGGKSNFTARIEPMLEAKRSSLQGTPQQDPDMTRAAAFMRDMQAVKTQAEWDALGKHTGFVTFVNRMLRDRPDNIGKMLREAHAAVEARLKAEASEGGEVPQDNRPH